MSLLIEVAGWTGALLLLVAYALVSVGRISSTSFLYQLMNVVGAGALVVNSGWNGAFPSATLNLVWMGIGIVALFRLPRVVS